MANTLSRTIKNSWSLVAFAKTFGPKVATGDCVNHDSGEVFKAVAFTANDGTRTFVSFSSNLGVLSGSEIAAQKNDLQVVQFEESGNYCLCRQGESSWESIDLL